MKHLHVFLRMERRAVISWAIGVAGVMLLYGLLFVAFGQEDFEEILEAYPPELKDAFPDLASVDGFIKAEMGTLLPLVLGLYLVFLMTKHLAGAEEGGRLDHTMARPITRSTYYWHTVLGGVVAYSIIIAAMILGGIAGFAATASLRDLIGIVGLCVEYFVLGLPFLGLGAVFGAIMHRRGPANGLGAAVVVAFFVIDLASRLVDGGDWLVYLSPMGYLSKSDLFAGDPSLVYFTVVPAFAGILCLTGWLVFNRKDLYA